MSSKENRSNEEDGVREQVLEEINGHCRTNEQPLWENISDAFWKEGVTKGHVEEYIASGQNDEIALSNAAIHIYGLAGQVKRGEKGGVPDKGNYEDRGDVTPIETKPERECREASNEFLDGLISKSPDVIDFRKRLPEGEAMNADRAIDFLALPLCRFFRFRQLEEWDVCPSSSTAGFVSITALAPPPSVEFPINNFFEMSSYARWAKPGVVICMTMTTRGGETIQRSAQHLMRDYCLLSDGREHRSSVADVMGTDRLYLRNSTNRLTGMPIRTVEGFRQSIVGEALTLSEKISKRVGWEPVAALLYLLTGEILHDKGCFYATLATNTLTVYDQEGVRRDESVWGRVKFTLHPWVSPASIRHLQKVVKKKTASTLMPKERGIEIFRFVNQERSKTPDATWEELYKAWTKITVFDTGADPRNFHRDYVAAKKALFPPRALQSLNEMFQTQR